MARIDDFISDLCNGATGEFLDSIRGDRFALMTPRQRARLCLNRRGMTTDMARRIELNMTAIGLLVG